jgi:putative SOS response-associated peptidase YedK
MCYALSFSADIPDLFKVMPALGEAPINVDGFYKVYMQTPDSFPLWPVIYNDEGVDKLSLMEWSVLPIYLSSPDQGEEERRKMAFARTSELLDKNSYWSRMLGNRCLIPVTGFFEHHAMPRQQGEIPVYIKPSDSNIFFIAGIYAYAPFADTESGEPKGTFAIVTRKANDLLNKINNTGPLAGHMPLILSNALAEEWNNPDAADIDLYDMLTYTFPSDDLEYWPVKDLKSASPNDEEVIAVKKELILSFDQQ